MSTSIPFYKMSAAGNDFVLVDNRGKILPRNVAPLAKRWCHRQFSIGADGLIILEPSKRADFKMRFFNADGSQAAMCGNGARSLARFACLIGAASEDMTFETAAGLIQARILDAGVRLRLSEPRSARLDFPIKVDKKEFAVSFVDTGVPHTVVFVKDIEKADVVGLGRMVRCHRAFAPAGTNVDFVEKQDKHTLLVRTYERGVEDETLACGTGVTASAIIAGLKGFVAPPVSCVTRGGYTLRVSYSLNAGGDLRSPVSNVSLEGPADVSFRGEAEL